MSLAKYKIQINIFLFIFQIKKWIQTSSLKFGRTEHVMALVYGIPTIIGGISEEGFLSR